MRDQKLGVRINPLQESGGVWVFDSFAGTILSKEEGNGEILT